jgi:hypothetical protein
MCGSSHTTVQKNLIVKITINSIHLYIWLGIFLISGFPAPLPFPKNLPPKALPDEKHVQDCPASGLCFYRKRWRMGSATPHAYCGRQQANCYHTNYHVGRFF